VLHRACSLPAAFSKPVLGLSENNLRPLLPLLRFLLLGDKIAQQKLIATELRRTMNKLFFRFSFHLLIAHTTLF
jgi:hypothetical protein